MTSIAKDAAKDAREYVAAQMFYGEGAGTRRKHITHAVAYKTERIPGYHEAFNKTYEQLDPTAFVKQAKRTRRAKDISASASRNAKALARGDRNGMSTGVLVVVVTAGVLHKTGYDKVLWEKAKPRVNKARAWLKEKL